MHKIDKNAAVTACDYLYRNGLILKSEYTKLKDDAIRGVTLKGFAVEQLGKTLASFWLLEEIAEYRIITESFLNPLTYSVPEWIVSQMDARFPWHDGERFIGGGIEGIFSRESAEPWHFGHEFWSKTKHSETSEWFKTHDVSSLVEKILVSAYGWKDEAV